MTENERLVKVTVLINGPKGVGLRTEQDGDLIILTSSKYGRGTTKQEIKVLIDPSGIVSKYYWNKAFYSLIRRNAIYSPDLHLGKRNPVFYLGRWESQIGFISGRQ